MGCRIFVAWSVLFTENLNKVTTASLNWVTGSFGWLYLVVTLAILVFLIFLAFSRSGNIRLGKDTDRPEFSTLTWLAMILSAVMGIGLVSYGVAEPISHLATPPHDLAEAGSSEAAVRALRVLPISTGVCTPGQSSRCSAWPSRIPPIARAATRW